jgi:hypothetical protein
MEEATMLFDKEFGGAIEENVDGGGLFFGDHQWRVTSLPIRVGGLGLNSRWMYKTSIPQMGK